MNITLPKLLIVAFIALAPLASRVCANDTYSGQFYLCVDDRAVVFLNGKPLMEGAWNKRDKFRKSGEVSVRVGDRLVFQLKNIIHVSFMAVEFVSSDLKTVISFPLSAYRQLPDPTAKDFQPTSLGFGNLPAAKTRNSGPGYLPFKSDSDGVWGDTDVCALGAFIKPEMVKPLRK